MFDKTKFLPGTLLLEGNGCIFPNLLILLKGLEMDV